MHLNSKPLLYIKRWLLAFLLLKPPRLDKLLLKLRELVVIEGISTVLVSRHYPHPCKLEIHFIKQNFGAIAHNSLSLNYSFIYLPLAFQPVSNQPNSCVTKRLITVIYSKIHKRKNKHLSIRYNLESLMTNQRVHRIFVFGLTALLLASFAGIAGNHSITKNAFADDTWYIGKGVQKGMYVEYNLMNRDSVDGRQFLMMIYFKGQDSSGNWLASSWVSDQGTVISGNLTLSSVSLFPLANPQTPPEMAPYLDAYKNSLGWIAAFAYPAQPQSLTSQYWGKIASIGGQPIAPMGTEKISTPAGTFDTTVVGWHKGVDDKLWILSGFPYPVQALVYAEITQGQPPVQFQFQLQKTGTSATPPAPPTGFENIPKPPQKQQTAPGTYTITLDWSPQTIEPGKKVQFLVSIIDNTGLPVNQASYNFDIENKNGTVLKSFSDQFLNGGIGSPITTSLNSTGPYNIHITITSVEGQDMGVELQDARFNVVATQVTPEFPVSIVALTLAAVVSLIVLVTRFKPISVGRDF